VCDSIRNCGPCGAAALRGGLLASDSWTRRFPVSAGYGLPASDSWTRRFPVSADHGPRALRAVSHVKDVRGRHKDEDKSYISRKAQPPKPRNDADVHRSRASSPLPSEHAFANAWLRQAQRDRGRKSGRKSPSSNTTSSRNEPCLFLISIKQAINPSRKVPKGHSRSAISESDHSSAAQIHANLNI